MPSKAKKCDMLIIMQFHWKSPRYDAWFLGLILTNSVTTISLLNLSVYWGPHLQNGIIWLLVIKIRWIKYVRWLANWVPRSSLHECRLSPSAPEGTEREPAPYRDCLRVTPPPILPPHLRGQRVVVRGLAGQQDVREALFLPHDNVPKATVAFVLADAVPEPLVKDVVLLRFQLPLHWAVQV